MILILDLSYPRKLVSRSIDNILFEAKYKSLNINDYVKTLAAAGTITALSCSTANAEGLKEEGKKFIQYWKEMKDPAIMFACEVLKYRKAFKFYINYIYSEIKS